MDRREVSEAIEEFLHPTVFTGTTPLLLVAEEVAADNHLGSIIDAVWFDLSDEDESLFSYITKFAVKGKITNRYYSSDEVKPFCDRVALPKKENLEKMILHRMVKDELEDVKAKRYALINSIEKEFESLIELVEDKKEVSFFKKFNGDWRDPFSDINIDLPYKIVYKDDNSLTKLEYYLKHPKTGFIQKYSVERDFYAYIVGSKADIDGLKLKDESYKTKIATLEEKAREIFKSIEWLYLKDPEIESIRKILPKHPFDNYFKYVKKGQERKLQVQEHLLKAVEKIVEKHMPDNITPFGVKYIPVDNLLYLFHEVVPRKDALRALEVCDIIHEPAGLLLGFEGKRELPPKFLVAVEHIVYAYKKFPSFIEACERYLKE